MVLKLKIDVELCTACKLCQQVCIRDNIIVEDHAIELDNNCFECGHCMAICRQNAITLKSFECKEDRIVDYNPRESVLEYDDLLESKVTGSSIPVSMAKSFYDEIYGERKPNNFVQPNSVFKIKVDKVLLNQGKIAMANDFLPTNEVVEEYFSKYNMPKQISDRIPDKDNKDDLKNKSKLNNIFDQLLFDFKRLKIG